MVAAWYIWQKQKWEVKAVIDGEDRKNQTEDLNKLRLWAFNVEGVALTVPG